MIAINNLEFAYPTGNFFLHIPEFLVEKHEKVAVIGPSGTGKTTMLNIIGSLDGPSEGSAVVLGQSVGELSHKKAAKLRKESLGFIFQTYNLLPVYTVFENVEFPLLLLDMSTSEKKKAVNEALEWVGLSDKVK